MTKKRRKNELSHVERQELKICYRVISQWGSSSRPYTITQRYVDYSSLKRLQYPERYAKKKETKRRKNQIYKKMRLRQKRRRQRTYR